MAKRELTDEQSALLRERLRRLVDERFDGKLTHAANALGFRHPTVSNVLSGKHRAGFALANAVEKFLGVDPQLRANAAEGPGAIPMIMWCPLCGARHIDRGVFAVRPHSTHACQTCGATWRPTLVATVGVEFLPGFKNAIDPASSFDGAAHAHPAVEIPSRTKGVMEEIARERLRAEAKHGAWSASGVDLPFHAHSQTRSVELPALETVREIHAEALRTGNFTFEHILMCEVVELLNACTLAEQREELKQVAGVCAARVEVIDRILEAREKAEAAK